MPLGITASRIAFFGSDRFSTIIAQGVHDATQAIKLVITPVADRKSRERREGASQLPLSIFARANDIQTIYAQESALLKALSALQPDIILSASFGHLISSSIIDLVPPLHALNVHPSLLPRWRGAAPIQCAIANRDAFTGVTIQELSKGQFDAGRVLAQSKVALPPDAYYADMEEMLAQESIPLVLDLLANFEEGKKNARPQKGLSKLARKITGYQSQIDWPTSDALKLGAWHRATSHQFPLWTTLRGKRVQFKDITSDTAHDLDEFIPPGTATLASDGGTLLVQCVAGRLAVSKVQKADRKELSASAWWNGAAKGARTLQFE